MLRATPPGTVLRRQRARSSIGKPTRDGGYRAGEVIAEAVQLLAALREQGTDLWSCTQRQLDAGLAGHPRRTRLLPAFLRWAARHLLHDTSLPSADRAAGRLLLLLYGQPTSRIALLTRKHLQVTDVTGARPEVRLQLGTDLLLLPEPLAGLVQALPDWPPPGMAGRPVVRRSSARSAQTAAGSTNRAWHPPRHRPLLRPAGRYACRPSPPTPPRPGAGPPPGPPIQHHRARTHRA